MAVKLWLGVGVFVVLTTHLVSYMVAVTIAGDRAAELDLCLAALTAFSREAWDSVFKVISERPVFLTSECQALGDEAVSTYFKRLRFDVAGWSGARTHDLPDAKQEHYH
jgi:hypothetical protein